jgi:hypothetical protein
LIKGRPHRPRFAAFLDAIARKLLRLSIARSLLRAQATVTRAELNQKIEEV